MELSYVVAGPGDIDALVSMRIKVLRAANKLGDTADMSAVIEPSRQYYLKSLCDDDHVAYLVYDGCEIIGTGGISFYNVLPPCSNPSGRKSYIMNMYTSPDYRRMGVAAKTLELLVNEAKKRGITAIGLEATDIGRPLYEKYGFVAAGAEMELP